METIFNEKYRKQIIVWLLAICTLVFGMVVLGGVTRLTHSGLSMVNWDPIMGAIPPLNEDEWNVAFDEYKKYPEYQKVNVGMSLDEFKSIFFWEYFHRLVGRSIGLVFFLPFLYFWIRGALGSNMKKRLLWGLVLGGMQGLMGWLMVASGLVDRPSVSHFRLAAHLLLAFFIFAYFFWIALDFIRQKSGGACSTIMKKFMGVSILTVIQIMYGAFVAGKKAGFGFNTFPKMEDSWLPEAATTMTPFILNFFENPVMIQFIHRVLAYLTVAAISWFFISNRKELIGEQKRAAHIVAGVVTLQFILGVLTILLIVSSPVFLPTVHQVGGFILFGSLVYLGHTLYKP